MEVKSLNSIKNLRGKTVLLRLDLNVPINNRGISDDWRIIKTLPTIHYLIQKDARVVIVSHFGRPDGKWRWGMSLKPISRYLEKMLGKKIIFLKDKIGTPWLLKKIDKLKNGNVAMLENIRFYPGEEKNDLKFAKELAGLGNLFVNDGFAVCHRDGASISGITKFLPSASGFLLEEEVKVLGGLLGKPKKPFVILLGGAKASTKIQVIENLIKKADKILLGGVLATTFIAAKGYKIGSSVYDKESIADAKKYLKSGKIVLPVDVLVANAKKTKEVLRVEIGKEKNIIFDRFGIFDIGPATTRLYAEYLKEAETIAWNGPMGWFEKPEFSYGTRALARLVASRSYGKVLGVVGGGETIEALRQTKMERFVDWVSTGGGAMLEFLAGKKMPGIEPLIKK